MCGKMAKALKLGGHTRLEWQVLKYLTSTQIEGVRFLYQNFIKVRYSRLLRFFFTTACQMNIDLILGKRIHNLRTETSFFQ